MTGLIPALLVALLLVSVVMLGVLLWRGLRPTGGGAERALREELRAGRDEARDAGRQLREEVAVGLKSTHDTTVKTIGEMSQQQRVQLETVTRQLKDLSDGNQARLESLRATVDERLKQLQENNQKKLDEMRRTVDEKLQSTLEKRLGESFKLVSERLEAVQRGLGEMKSLATGVGDLKRVLTNVKTRGTWGEVQLGAILEQILTADQYDRNVQTKEGSQQNVEYAVRLPGPDGQAGSCVWLPIDSKFPQEDYVRLTEAAEHGDTEAVAQATAALTRAVRTSAQDIRDKYLNPPSTTDFALMFLPTESLYAEVLRQPGLVEQLQQTYRVVPTGPMTLAAILSSLRLGFRTLAIEQRASEVWRVLAAVKVEFGKFGDVLEKVKRQLQSASKTIDQTGARTRAMERRLREVETLPREQAPDVLRLDVPASMLDDLADDGAAPLQEDGAG